MKTYHILKNNKAFTLIELLIVVAIIAILAAIAVPNFLEAQTRSKVSRALADMRTITTGLESYRIDNTNYPNSAVDAPFAPASNAALLNTTVYAALSTPISYLSSFPTDAFGGDKTSSSSPASDPLGLKKLYDYRKVRLGPSTVAPGNTFFESKSGLMTQTGQEFKQWLLYSPGPDLEQNINTGMALNNTVNVSNFSDPLSGWPFYDSSNGTISIGDIVRTPFGGAESIIGR